MHVVHLECHAPSSPHQPPPPNTHTYRHTHTDNGKLHTYEIPKGGKEDAFVNLKFDIGHMGH